MTPACLPVLCMKITSSVAANDGVALAASATSKVGSRFLARLVWLRARSEECVPDVMPHVSVWIT